MASVIGGITLQERLVPYANAHLLEEAMERLYHPMKDWAFVTSVTIDNVVSFGVASCVACFINQKNSIYLASGVLIFGLSASVWIHFHVFSALYPSPMQVAYAFELALAIVAVIGGFYAAKKKRMS